MQKLSNKKRKEILELIRFLENQTRGENDKERLTHLKSQIYKLRDKI